LKTIIYYFLVIITISSSCTKVPNDGIPTYMKLNKSTIENASISQGSTLNQFPDLWVQSGGVNLGAYETPTIFAALLKGEQKVTINPGVYYNGSRVERVIYPIYEPFEATYSFVQEDTIEISPIFKYRANVNFVSIEDFESSNNFSEMLRTDIGDTENIEGKAGVITLNTTDTRKTSSTISAVPIPDHTKRTYLEFTLKTESGVQIIMESLNGYEYELVRFQSFEDWYTTYFEITDYITASNDDEYNFHIIATKKDTLTTEEKTYFDNFKIIQH
jgi:hypothetical protein